ncbi:MAG: response regulator [Campylobacterota bacterium]|nr:response regulator [Campylobacterota bacterium]
MDKILVDEMMKLAKGKKVLIVEDDERIIDAFASVLKNYFSLVKTAADGKEGWEMYRKEPFDLVISDIEMPVTDGLMLSKGIKARNPDQAVLIISAYSEEKYLVPLINKGVDGFIKKPINIVGMHECIVRTLKKIQAKKELERTRFNAYVNEIVKKDFKLDKSPRQKKIEEEETEKAKVTVKEFMDRIKDEDPETYHFFDTQKEVLMETLHEINDNYEMIIYKEFDAQEEFENMLDNMFKLYSTLNHFDRVSEVTTEVLRLSEILRDVDITDMDGNKLEAFDILEFLINDIKQYIMDMFFEENVADVNYFHDSYRENITLFENTLNQEQKDDDDDLEFF